MSIDQLIDVCPPPERPVANIGGWTTVEAELGIVLPKDYKALVETYGAGTFGEFIVVWSPFRSETERGLVGRARAWLDGQRQLRSKYPAEFPYPLLPEPGGVLPWGVTDNGDVGYWLTDPDSSADAWTIALNESRGPAWFAAPGPLTSFLADVLARRIAVDFFPPDFPPEQARPSFRPATAP